MMAVGAWGDAGDVILCLLPLVLLVVLTLWGTGMPAYKSLPIAALCMWTVRIAYLGSPPALVSGAVVLGVLETFTPLTIIMGAMFLFETMEVTNCLSWFTMMLKQLSAGHPIAEIMLISFAFEYVVEGASGFGTPVALASPILATMGHDPVDSIVVGLIMNTMATIFGAAGTPIWFGFAGLLPDDDLIEVGFRGQLLNGICGLLIPIIAIRFLVGWKNIFRSIIFIYLSILSAVGPAIGLSYFSFEFPSLVGGLIGLFVTGILVKFRIGLREFLPDLEKPKATKTTPPPSVEDKPKGKLWGMLNCVRGSRHRASQPVEVNGTANGNENGFASAVDEEEAFMAAAVSPDEEEPTVATAAAGGEGIVDLQAGENIPDRQREHDHHHHNHKGAGGNNEAPFRLPRPDVPFDIEYGADPVNPMSMHEGHHIHGAGHPPQHPHVTDHRHPIYAAQNTEIPHFPAHQVPQTDPSAATKTTPAEATATMTKSTSKSATFDAKMFQSTHSVSVAASQMSLDLTAQVDPDKVWVEPKWLMFISRTFCIWSSVVLLVLTRVPQIGLKDLMTRQDPHFTVDLNTLGQLRVSAALVFTIKNVMRQAFISWKYELLYVPAYVPFVLVSVLSTVYFALVTKEVRFIYTEKAIWKAVLSRLKMPAVALTSALILVQLIRVDDGSSTSPATIIGIVLARAFSYGWIAISFLIGGLGSFFSGSTTISNLTFGGVQQIAAKQLDVSDISMLALQSVGATAGNMVCLNNIVNAKAVMNVNTPEGDFIKKTGIVFLIYYVLATAVGGVLFFVIWK